MQSPPIVATKMSIKQDQIYAQLAELGLAGQDLAVHASLGSFGEVTGGAGAVVAALCELTQTVMMPSFCSLGRSQAPAGDRPQQNAWDYDAQGPSEAVSSFFDPASFNCESALDLAEMGQIPAALLKRVHSLRSQHPSVSWVANGKQAGFYTSDHLPMNPNLPLKRLVERDGVLLLLGVGLSACTAVHLSEELAGRRPFIRWVRYRDGEIRRVYEYGCSDAFDQLSPHVEHLAQRCMIGGCAVVAYPVGPYVTALAAVIAAQPEITICGRAHCRCLDAARGGPIG